MSKLLVDQLDANVTGGSQKQEHQDSPGSRESDNLQTEVRDSKGATPVAETVDAASGSPPPSGSANSSRGSRNASPIIIDPFTNVHKMLARPIESGPVASKVVAFKVPVSHRPHKGRWCAIHSDPNYSIRASFLVFGRDEIFLLDPTIAPEFEGEDVYREATVYTGVLRPNCAPFLLHVTSPRPEARTNDYWTSMHAAAKAGMSQWMRVITDQDAGCYIYEVADLSRWPVRWPDVPFGELLRRGFKNPDRFIDSMDHAVVKELRGDS